MSTIDHGVPTANRQLGIRDPLSKKQIDTLVANCEENGITLYGLDDPCQGIVHVIGPEQGITQPGMTIVCGDSHTATHGAFGALAFGIGTSEVEHVLATQTLPQLKPKSMAVTVDGELPRGVEYTAPPIRVIEPAVIEEVVQADARVRRSEPEADARPLRLPAGGGDRHDRDVGGFELTGHP